MNRAGMRCLPLLLVLVAPAALAQGIMEPLGLQGLEQHEVVSVQARGMGSVYAALPGSAESVMLNPASLVGVERVSVAASGVWNARGWAETQHWNPNRYYAGLSLYFADPEDYTTEPLANPDWTHDQQSFQLASVSVVLPLQVGDRALVLGATLHQVAQLGDYDRNDNVLDPYIGQFRPQPVERPRPGEEIEVTWSAFERERSGHLRGVGAALGYELSPNLHVGLRIERAWGEATDRQHLARRGIFLLRESAHDYTHEAVQGSATWEGTASFGSWRSTLGLRWQYSVLSLGLAWQFPSTVTHRYHYNRSGDLLGEVGVRSNGFDDVTVPARMTAGVALRPVPSVLLTFDYVRQDFSALEGSSTAVDWGLVQGIGLGLEWQIRSTSAVRIGFRNDPQPFRITGSGLLDETARGDAYSAGLSQDLRAITLHVSYEFQRLRYHDRWESNVDYNKINKHNLLFGAAYTF